MSINNMEGSLFNKPAQPPKSRTWSALFQTLSVHIFPDIQWYAWWSCHSNYFTSSATSIVLCAMPLPSKWNWRSVCMTPHYILQRKRRRNNMKIDPAGTSSQSVTLMCLWSCHTGRGSKTESVVPICITRGVAGYWLVWVCVFCL